MFSMGKFLHKIFDFFKKEIVFSISLFLAICSCLIVKPNINCLNYINWDTILLLFLVMIVVEVFKNLSVFEFMFSKLLTIVGNTRKLVFLLVFACFFSSIFITNDVSLILFVPFSIFVLKKVDKVDLVILTVCLQTIAANVGCMVLPIGAPHNIVLFTSVNISFWSFLSLLLPYILVSIIFLSILLLFVPKDRVDLHNKSKIIINHKNLFKRVFSGVDYYLLFTFIALFVLIGNLENISFFYSLFTQLIKENEVLYGILISQIISNVPAAILLTGFSTNVGAIIIGVNIGGFGTLIASMANLISYNIVIREYAEFKIKYLIQFSILNLILLTILLIVNFFIN